MQPDDDAQARFAQKLMQAREKMPPDKRRELDEVLSGALDKAMQRLRDLERAVSALDLLHQEGQGERAGFCAECGNVMPCTTAKFLARVRA